MANLLHKFINSSFIEYIHKKLFYKHWQKQLREQRRLAREVMKLTDITYTLIVLYLVLNNSEGFSNTIKATTKSYIKAVEALKGYNNGEPTG